VLPLGVLQLRTMNVPLITEVVDPEDSDIAALPKTFASVSTDLESGIEYWFTQGSVRNAVRGSMSLPGLFTPMRHEERWLVDGGLVNPVPVSDEAIMQGHKSAREEEKTLQEKLG
jgi:predicted acylesterase/phospholipase RssA